MPRRKKLQGLTMSKPYPIPQATRSGCKVTWYYYDKEADAIAAAAAAKFNRVEREAQGYDFGYQSPGAPPTMTLAGANAGKWQVCIP